MSIKLPTETVGVTREELRRLTYKLTDEVERVIRRAKDADVPFQPVDPAANDPGALLDEEVHIVLDTGRLRSPTPPPPPRNWPSWAPSWLAE